MATSLKTQFARTLSCVYFCYENNLKIPVELPKPSSPKEKHQSLLHAIGGGWYVKKLGQNIPPLKKKIINQKIPKGGG